MPYETVVDALEATGEGGVLGDKLDLGDNSDRMDVLGAAAVLIAWHVITWAVKGWRNWFNDDICSVRPCSR